MALTPVSRETFLQEASFYSALSRARPDDKIVLIRIPKEMSAADLDGQSLLESEIDSKDEDEKTIGKFSVKLRSKNKRPAGSVPSSVGSSSYTIKSSRRNLRVNSLALTQPPSSAAAPLASTQQLRLAKSFDEFWCVNLGVEVDEIPMKKISKVVKKRAEAPLVEQPRNLRMRLLPFSTPSNQ